MRLVLVVALSVALAAPAAAQRPPFAFGSADAPDEPHAPPNLRAAGRADVRSGLAYVGTRWHAGLGAEVRGAVGPFAVALEGALRTDATGLRAPDVRDAYDLLRTIRYVRLNPTLPLPLYARIGPLERTTLGSGLLVRDLRTDAAWDERTVGAEAAFRTPLLEAEAFAADLRLNGPAGGRLALRPFGVSADPRLRSVLLAGSAVHDPRGAGLTAVAAELQWDALRFLDDFHVRPLLAAARIADRGDGALLGLAFGSDDLAGFGRLQATTAVTIAGRGFVPGYLNPFYAVDNPVARIVDSDAHFRDPATAPTVGPSLGETPGGAAIVLGLRALLYGEFELASHLRRDMGGRTGEFSLRLGVAPGDGEAVRLLFELHRQGLTGLRALFSDLTDEALLVFTLDYPLTGPLWLQVRSRYGYTRLEDGPDGTARFLVERRFEPMLGLRLRR